MDALTLFICTALASLVMIVTLGGLYIQSKAERYLVDWMAAGTCFMFSSILAILSRYYELPAIIHPSLGNGLYLAGHAAILSGVAQLLNKQSNWLIVIAVILLAILLHFIPAVASSVNIRILVFYPIIISLNGTALTALWKRRNDEYAKAYWLLMVVLSFFIVQLLIRGGILLVIENDLTFFGNQFMQTSGSLAIIFFLFSLTLSFSIIVTWKKEVALRQASVTDYLTGWLNRKALDSIAHREFSRVKRTGGAIGFIVIDIDHFKKINDTYGHSIGDIALKETASITKGVIREYDSNFRLGGEEFAVLVSEITDSELYDLAERIRMAIEQQRIRHAGIELTLTVSIGLSHSTASDTRWEQVIERADKALYQSKDKGRNRTTVYSVENFTTAVNLN